MGMISTNAFNFDWHLNRISSPAFNLCDKLIIKSLTIPLGQLSRWALLNEERTCLTSKIVSFSSVWPHRASANIYKFFGFFCIMSGLGDFLFTKEPVSMVGYGSLWVCLTISAVGFSLVNS